MDSQRKFQGPSTSDKAEQSNLPLDGGLPGPNGQSNVQSEGEVSFLTERTEQSNFPLDGGLPGPSGQSNVQPGGELVKERICTKIKHLTPSGVNGALDPVYL